LGAQAKGRRQRQEANYRLQMHWLRRLQNLEFPVKTILDTKTLLLDTLSRRFIRKKQRCDPNPFAHPRSFRHFFGGKSFMVFPGKP
jgi:hypothetical protein